MKGKVIRILTQKALSSDVQGSPDYYAALYTFFTGQGEVVRAGFMMYQLGCRLAEELTNKHVLRRMVSIHLSLLFDAFISIKLR